MGAMEPADVVQLEYVMADDGSNNTLARLTLRLNDPRRALYGCEFKVGPPGDQR